MTAETAALLGASILDFDETSDALSTSGPSFYRIPQNIKDAAPYDVYYCAILSRASVDL